MPVSALMFQVAVVPDANLLTQNPGEISWAADRGRPSGFRNAELFNFVLESGLLAKQVIYLSKRSVGVSR